ncbi:MAG: DNA repair photolyase, partial [Candidatus Azotimanducaceae bacterium]
VDRTKTLITKNKSPDIPFDQSINPYKGCEHGCIYCFARPTHAYLDLSPGLDFETKIFRKTEPRHHLMNELAKPSYVCSVIAMGTNTDPYQPFEKSQRVTREILETLLELKHPVSIVTKSKLILRDLDLLVPLAEMGLVQVNISLTTLDQGLKTKLEPRTASPAARLRTLAELRAAGVPVGALVAPIIPFINDHEIEDLVASAADAGALCAKYVLLRLPLEVKPLMEEWLQTHFPLRAERVMAAVRDTRGGKAYQSGWHTRMVGQGPIAELIRARFHKAVKDANLGSSLDPLRTDFFIPPARPTKVPDSQLSLF